MMKRLFQTGMTLPILALVASCSDGNSITSAPDAAGDMPCTNLALALGEGSACSAGEPGEAYGGSDLGFSTLVPIPQPNANYLASTTLIDISGIPSWLDTLTPLPSVSDGTLTVSFSPRALKLSSGEWTNWGSPPESESSMLPHVLFSDFSTTMTLDLSEPVSVFGFEIAPNPYDSHTFTVDFIDTSGPTVVETIVQDADGGGGSRLVASDLDAPIDRVVITGTADFAIAWLRFALPEESVVSVEIEVPGTVNVRSRGLIPVTLFGSSEFDVADVDVETLTFDPGGAYPVHSRRSDRPPVGHFEDANHDGLPDLVLHFPQTQVSPSPGDEEVCLTGTTVDGTAFEGCAAVRVIRPGQGR